MTSTGYQLSRRHHGGLIMGLSAVQSGLLTAAIGSLVLIPTLTRTAAGVITGVAIAFCCGLIAFVPLQGRPMHLVLPALVRFSVLTLGGRHLWLAPCLRTPNTRPRRRPRAPAVLVASREDLPRCLTGLQLHHTDRPDWAGQHDGDPVAILRDTRTGTLTVILSVRGNQFDLVDDSSQHAQLRNWGHVLTQFGREASPLTRLGWSLWSAPRSLIHPTHTLRQAFTHPDDLTSAHDHQSSAGGEQLLQERPVGNRHELRVWISIDPARAAGRRADPMRSVLAAAQSLTERCQAAGLSVRGPLSAVEVIQTVRRQADPFTSPTARHARPQPPHQHDRPDDGCGHLVDAAPQSVMTFWDAVSIEGAWHRSFWVTGWPAAVTHPQWLNPLVQDPGGVRAITVIYEPISLRVSRRRITADAVALDSQLQLRHKHDFRVPVHLHHAQADIDQREAELGAGWCEYAHLALITITAPTRESLDNDSQALLDQAAQCGIVGLQPVNAHHAAAWAVSLPLGRAPDHEFLTGGRS